MEGNESVIAEFTELHNRYKKAHDQIVLLQAVALEGIRKIGVGCITEESRTEFITLEKEINQVLVRMRQICESLH